MHAYYKKGKHAWDNTLDLAYGFVSTTSLGTRKADDRIDLLSKYGYDIGKNWYISGLFNFRSQFAPGYAYPANLPKQLTSDFLAPAYILLSPGLNYKPNDNFSFFISPATARWVIVNNDSLSLKGAVYNGRLDLFSNYLHNPQNISLNWTNVIAVKVSKYISMSLSVNIIYDNDIKSVNADGTVGGPKPQIQELFGIGIAYKF